MAERGAQVVVGASGGLGRAFVEALTIREPGAPVYALSRSDVDLPPGVTGARIDITDEASIVSAFVAIREPIEFVVVATGRLLGDGVAPERSFAAIEPEALAQSFLLNTIGPTLVAKHVLPRLPRDQRAVFAALSARVGSIEDNRLGGWYGYRASKAALNMMVRTLAVELARTHPLALCVALHPGTVDTALSRPFQRNVAADTLFSPEHSAGRLLDVIKGLTPKDSGGLFAYDGARIPF